MRMARGGSYSGAPVRVTISVAPGRGSAGDPDTEAFLHKVRTGRIRLMVDRSNRVVPA
jgi:hypothetical protein